MLRIHFTEGDREPIVAAAEPDPMWEVLLSLHALRGDAVGPAHTRWRSHVTDRMDPLMRRLAALAPPAGYSPDFLTPWCGDEGIEQGLEALCSTPRQHLRADLERLVAEQGPSAAAAELARGDPDALRGLAQAVRSYHRVAIAPHWDRIASVSRTAPASGPGGLPASASVLPGQWQWRGPVLEVAYPLDRDLHLHGRPLHVVPSFFCRRYPIAVCDPARAPVLAYPVRRPAADWPARDRRVVGRLIGHTRALVLRAAVDGGTTSDLAGRLDLSGPTVSEHISVLRDSGLVSSCRQRNRVRHIATAAGCGLLGGVADDFACLADGGR